MNKHLLIGIAAFVPLLCMEINVMHNLFHNTLVTAKSKTLVIIKYE